FLDAGDDRLRFLRLAMRDEPARAFRQPEAHEKDEEAEHAADEEGESPAELRIDYRRIEEHDRGRRAERRADPEAPVDDEVGPAAHPRRDQFLDRGIDRGIFTADAGAREETEQREAREIP